MKEWTKNLNIPLPECGQCGTCCNCASPSATYLKLLEKAAAGEEFARDFFSIFIPYKNIQEVEKLYPSIVNKTVKVINERIQKADAGVEEDKCTEEPVKLEDIVFYKCRYYSSEKQCLIYEDRPALCRDFPGSPYVILSESCAYYDWSMECREKHKSLKQELEDLKKYKEVLNNIKCQEKAMRLNYQLKRVPEEYKFMWLCPSLSLVSPGKSWIKVY